MHLGDCREIAPSLQFTSVVSDPPYPNNSELFVDDIETAREFLRGLSVETVLWFWSERDTPECGMPLCAVHIWHRTNVNGKVYEPIRHYSADGEPRRSEVIPHAAVFNGVGPGCSEYAGHPTQKPIGLMERLVLKTSGAVLDPFMGSGSTGVACAHLGRKFVGIEKNAGYFDIACKRIEAAYAQQRLFA